MRCQVYAPIQEGDMRLRGQTYFWGIAAGVLLAFFAGPASASRFAFDESRFVVIWSSLRFYENVGLGVTCPATMSGTFHSRTISKVSGQLVGYIDRINVREAACIGGIGKAPEETLPWHLRYDSFAGTLPRITRLRIQIIGLNILNHIFEGPSCLFESTAAAPVFADFIVSELTGNLTSLDTSGEIPLKRRLNTMGFSCETRAEFSTALAEVKSWLEDSTTRIRVTLVR
jgi:hypothetical protein